MEECRRTPAWYHRSIPCGIREASARKPSDLGSAFPKTGGRGGKNPEATKTCDQRARKFGLQGASSSLGLAGKKSPECLSGRKAGLPCSACMLFSRRSKIISIASHCLSVLLLTLEQIMLRGPRSTSQPPCTQS